MSENHSPRTVDAVIGSACLLTGVALAVMVVAVRLEGLWHLPTGLIRRNPVVMLGFAVMLALAGSRLLWQARHVVTLWSPSRPGRRFDKVVLYTKAGCPLCDEAAQVLAAYQPYLPPIKTIDVTADAGLEARYAGCVPVVEIDGRKRFTGHINEILLRRLIEGTPPDHKTHQVLKVGLLGFLLVWGDPIAVACADDQTDNQPAAPIVWHTGRSLKQELDRPVNIVLNRTTPRAVVERLWDLHHVALLLDRRIDPDRPIDVQFTKTSLDEALQMLAVQLNGELAQIGGTLYIGPAVDADRLRTLIVLRTQEIREIEGAGAVTRKFELSRGMTLAWDDLAEPADLLENVEEAFHVKRFPDAEVPHDLWGRGVMADVSASEALGLLLGQFDLTFEWQDDGNAVRIVPAPEVVTIEQSHAPKRMTVAEAVEQIRIEWPHLKLQVEGRSITFQATAGEHDAVAALLAPPRPETPAEPTQGPLSRRRFTLNAPRAEAIAILRTLQTQGVTVVYDPDQLKQAGINLETKVSLELQQATADELFTSLCEPLGLAFEIDDTTVTLKPK